MKSLKTEEMLPNMDVRPRSSLEIADPFNGFYYCPMTFCIVNLNPVSARLFCQFLDGLHLNRNG